ncbi:unnamed protein product [Phaeothamnion confervicola]
MAPFPNLFVVATIVALPSFLFGYCVSSLNTALSTGSLGDSLACYYGNDPSCAVGSLLRDIKLSVEMQELATGLTIAGAWLGCLVGSRPSDRYGRRLTLLLNNVLFIGGAFLCSIPAVFSLFAGRLLVGLATGIECMVVPVLLSELAPAESRGAVTVLHQLLITIGILTASLMGYALVERVEHGWRYVQAFIAIPAALQLLLSAWVPESPRWLASHDRHDQARRVLTALRPVVARGGGAGAAAAVDEELEHMARAADKGERSTSHVAWSEVLRNRRVVAIGIAVMALQALVGINSVILYSTTIFALAGVSNGILGTVVVGVVNVLVTVVAVALVDRVGRRVLLLGGTALMAASLAALSVSLLTLNAAPRVQGVLSVVAALAYITGFAIGFGAVGWVVIAEIVPSRVRSKAYGLFVSTNWALNLLISLTTLTAISELGGVIDGSTKEDKEAAQKVGVAFLYLIFCGICVLSLAFIFLAVPETMGKSLEHAHLVGGEGAGSGSGGVDGDGSGDFGSGGGGGDFGSGGGGSGGEESPEPSSSQRLLYSKLPGSALVDLEQAEGGAGDVEMERERG